MEENVKAAKKQYSRLGGFFMLGTIAIFVVQLVPTAVVRLLRPEWLMNGDIALLISIVPMYLLGMPLLILMLKRLPARAPEKHKMSAGKFVVAFIMCYAVMYVCNIAGLLATSIIGMLKGSSVQNSILNIATSSNMLLTFIYMVICAPIFEEYIFRKLIIDSTMRYGQGTAVLVSGLMFGLFHGNLNQFVYAFGLGCFFAFLYVKTGNLKITVLLHMIINFMGGILGVLVLKLIHPEELLRVSLSGDPEEIMQIVYGNLPGWTVYMLYIVGLIGMVIAGIVLLIVFRKRFRLSGNAGGADQEYAIPKGKRFKTAVLNPGMLAYCVFWLLMILLQLFM